MKALIRIVAIALIFLSANAFALTVGVGDVVIGQNALSGKYHINKINIRNLLESELLNIPGVQLAARGHNAMQNDADELQLQESGLTSSNSSESFGHWKGAAYLVLPAINSANVYNHSIQYSNYVEPHYSAHAVVQLTIINVGDNTIVYSHVFDGYASSSAVGGNLVNDSISNAIKKVDNDKAIRQIMGQKRYNQENKKFANVIFKAPSNSTTKINGLLKGSGSFATQLPLDSVVSIVVTAPNCYAWKQRVKITRDMNIKVNMVAIPKKEIPTMRYEVDINQNINEKTN